MATLKYVPQYFTTKLNVGGGINDSQTTGIVLLDVSGVDTSKPGQICVSYSDPLDTSDAEWIDYTSINGSNELVGAVRGREGYSAKTHLQDATVAFVVSASHHNDIVDQLNGTATGSILKAPLLTHESSVSTPASGKVALYAKSDNKIYAKDSSGTESQVGGTLNRAFSWYLDGTSVVADEVGAKYIAPQNMTVTKIMHKTVSGTATIRLQKGTTDIDASISVTSSVASETSITSAAITAGDVITLDITAASSCVGLTVCMECEQ